MCVNPVILKSGICVPCGKCDICKSDRRNEWSIRLAMHLMSCDRMPMFVTLTYDEMHLPIADESCIWYRRSWPSWEIYNCDKHCFYPTLVRFDISKFIREYKRIYSLKNEDLQYFGCGEYGDKFGRPHYHLILFGDNDLYNLYFQDEELAREHIKRVWHLGNVHVGVAGFDGMHYVTKYCLKEGLNELSPFVVKPFTIASKNLGAAWLESEECAKIRSKLLDCQYYRSRIYRYMPDYDVYDLDSIDKALAYLQKFVPKFECILDDGRKVFVPRYFKRKLLGQFEHFKDNPLWLFNHLCQLRDSIKYYESNHGYDKSHDITLAREACQNRLDKIRKRLFEKQYNLNRKK